MKKSTKMDIIKTFLATAVAALLAYVEPVANTMQILVIMFTADIFLGILCGVGVHNERFHFRKFIIAAACLAVYLFIVALTYGIGRGMGDEAEALFIVKTITYLFIYFYATNILKNLTLLFPSNRAFKALYYALGLEFTKRMPWIDGFLKNENEKENDNTTEGSSEQ